MSDSQLSHAIDRGVHLTPAGDDRFAGHAQAEWQNMVGPFGGITAAAALNGVLQHPKLLGEPIALTVNFAAAIAEGPFEVRAVPVRTNRSTQHWNVEIHQEGSDGPLTTASVVTAARRETWSTDDEPMPRAPAPDTIVVPPYTPPVAWVNNYEIKPVSGTLPTAWDGSDGESSYSLMWMRDRPARTLDFVSMAAISDLFFPRIWRRRATRVPAGTVSITTYFHAGSEQMAEVGTQWLLGQAKAHTFRNGFFDQTGQIWSQSGHLLVTTHQIVYYKE
ncbi:thioesterase family protein [Hydrogenophaga sp. 5NK40-0174]|uniref:acyl-CoA thioesterase n=1 Tax=Hydrogenophaga sp. 5NK40-0174 TaxID=3127649 RepID=UPI003340A33D